MRIIVFGNSGSGKTTLARRLAEQHGLTHLDLDAIVWEPGKIAVKHSSVRILASLDSFLAAHQRWVIEGCYGELVEAASEHCTEMLFLNPGLKACLANNLRRAWEPEKYASPEQQDLMLANLQAWVAGYYERQDDWSFNRHRRIFDAFEGEKTELLDSNIAGGLSIDNPPDNGS
jgi:adenylate kinase family enzyme